MSTEINYKTCPSCWQRCVVTEEGALARHRLPAPRDNDGNYIVVDGVMTLGEWCPPLGIHHPDESL